MLSASESTVRRKIDTGAIAVCRATRHVTIAVEELQTLPGPQHDETVAR